TPTPPPATATAVSSRVPVGPTLARLPTWTPTPATTPTPLTSMTPIAQAGAAPLRVLASDAGLAATPLPIRDVAYHPWSQLPYELTITYPAKNQTVDGVVPVLGSASLPFFDRYGVQYGVGDAPTAWRFVGVSRPDPVRSGVLDTWDTSALPDG